MEADRTGLGELDGIGKQVVYDLFYAVRIPIKPDLRILEIAVEQDTLVIDTCENPEAVRSSNP